MGRKPEWWRRFWIEAAAMTAGLAVLGSALYLFNVIDLAQAVLWAFSTIFIVYALRHIVLDILSIDRWKLEKALRSINSLLSRLI